MNHAARPTERANFSSPEGTLKFEVAAQNGSRQAKSGRAAGNVTGHVLMRVGGVAEDDGGFVTFITARPRHAPEIISILMYVSAYLGDAALSGCSFAC